MSSGLAKIVSLAEFRDRRLLKQAGLGEAAASVAPEAVEFECPDCGTELDSEGDECIACFEIETEASHESGND